MGRNWISHLSGGIFASLNGLRRLILSNNRITSINDNAFVGLNSLEELSLENNHLIRVPSIPLQSLKRLRILSIGGNPFTSISTGDFVHSSVEELYIDNCPNLEVVDRAAFWDLPSLREVHLHSNPKLAFIDSQAFLGVSSLSILFLHNNSLLSVEEDLLESIVVELECSRRSGQVPMVHAPSPIHNGKQIIKRGLVNSKVSDNNTIKDTADICCRIHHPTDHHHTTGHNGQVIPSPNMSTCLLCLCRFCHTPPPLPPPTLPSLSSSSPHSLTGQHDHRCILHTYL